MVTGFVILTIYFTVVSLVLISFTLLTYAEMSKKGGIFLWTLGIFIILSFTFWTADELCFQLGHRISECSVNLIDN